MATFGRDDRGDCACARVFRLENLVLQRAGRGGGRGASAGRKRDPAADLDADHRRCSNRHGGLRGGGIAFVGLIAPHIVRRLVGEDYRYVLPGSALAGALVLLLADTFSRLIIAPTVLPVGAVTSFLGAPLFLMIILRQLRRKP